MHINVPEVFNYVLQGRIAFIQTIIEQNFIVMFIIKKKTMQHRECFGHFYFTKKGKKFTLTFSLNITVYWNSSQTVFVCF